MKNSVSRMKGATILGILFIVVVIVFGALILIRIVPPYIDYYQVKDSLDMLAKDPATPQMSKGKIREMFSRRLQVNNIKGIDPNQLEIENKNKQSWLMLKYETRVHILGNVDVVLMFDNQVMVGEKD